jgi:hypothetical protein
MKLLSAQLHSVGLILPNRQLRKLPTHPPISGDDGTIRQRTPSEKVFWFFFSKKDNFPSPT